MDGDGRHARVRLRFRASTRDARRRRTPLDCLNAPTSETLNVDNDPVSVSLRTPDDPNPTVWVNHAVTVDATPSTGPSGLGGMNCSVDGGAARSYPVGGLTVNGDGARTVSCTAWNNAVDPQGNHNSGSSSVTVHIDEAPPVDRAWSP